MEYYFRGSNVYYIISGKHKKRKELIAMMIKLFNDMMEFVNEVMYVQGTEEMVDDLDLYLNTINRDVLTNKEIAAYNSLQNTLWQYYSLEL